MSWRVNVSLLSWRPWCQSTALCQNWIWHWTLWTMRGCCCSARPSAEMAAAWKNWGGIIKPLLTFEWQKNHLTQTFGGIQVLTYSTPPCRLNRCELTQEDFEKLASVLKSGTSKLKSLGVGLNRVGDRGVQHLWDALAHPNCQLEELE